jgi:hypothetical protein
MQSEEGKSACCLACVHAFTYLNCQLMDVIFVWCWIVSTKTEFVFIPVLSRFVLRPEAVTTCPICVDCLILF